MEMNKSLLGKNMPISKMLVTCWHSGASPSAIAVINELPGSGRSSFSSHFRQQLGVKPGQFTS